jgi:PIN domain nuclease of toxin-antitoxin system
MSSAAEPPLLLDTHYWIWFQFGISEQVPSRLRLAIQQAAGAGALLLSIISVWELGLLEAKGRIQLNAPCHAWVSDALATPGLALVPLTPEIAIDSTRLADSFHGDPADRIIVATARRMKARLLTRDQKMLDYARGTGIATL